MGEAETPSFDMTWSSTTSSGYCSQEDSDSELEQYFTARTSLARRPRRDQNKDGSYTGFIKVQLKLVRPVSVPSIKKPPSLQDARRGLGRGTAVRRRTSFYLPKDAVKHLHVLSRTRASEVIEALLRKFLVVDDPRKFALFERAERHGQVYFRKLSDDEQPLRLRLLAGPSEKALSFILKENDSGEVNTTVKNSSKDYSSKSLTSKSPDLALVIIISWLSLGRVCLLGHACCILCTSPHPLPVGCLQHARITQFSAHPAARGRRTPPTDPAEVLPLPPKDPRGPACLPPGVTCYIPGWQEESRQCQERAV
ncbi:ras association domain-containing protein 1 isoform X6 [Heterocephalus glaber]|uniref:Ras association domain-containing protein 1 isoform X6 n=1 Tax=Heterocephalus glaber TaxID=10181 RepID=A0AAX6NPE7_HETGA|nr:ras association domain-containing protein 1 isoform X6 [Heterocephalus glaber]